MNKNNKHINDDIMESIITIKEKCEGDYHTISVEENGELYYIQTRHSSCHMGTKTFLDDFLERLGSGYNSTEKTTCDFCYVIPDGGNFFYFISKSRFKTLNFKQKFFHFLLKHLFLHGEAPTIENIKSFSIK